MRDLRPGPALAGSCGLPPWLAYHALLYLLVFSTSIVVWGWLDQGTVEGAAAVLVFSVLIGSVQSILPTVLLTAVLWAVRRQGRVRFRVVAVLVCCAPLVCVPLDRYALAVFVPVQVAYGLILRQPRQPERTGQGVEAPPGHMATAE